MKNAFKSAGLPYKPKILCTIKLAKILYPSLGAYNLANIAKHLQLDNAPTYWAINDSALLLAFIQKVFKEFSHDKIIAMAKKLQGSSSKPSKLITDLNTLPVGPGVYLFYTDKSDLPIYIGKSISIRQRVLSHFQTDHTNDKEFKMAQQIHRVEYKKTTGELSALLLESQLIKEYLPLYNHRLRRKKQRVSLRKVLKNNYIFLEITTQCNESKEPLIGSFNTVNAAKNYLLTLIKEYQLCPKLCSLEKTKYSCFSYQLLRCLGACIQKEDCSQYNARIESALLAFQDDPWPFTGAIAIKECQTDKINWLVFHDWQFLGATPHESEWPKLCNRLDPEQADRDTYKILKSYLQKKSNHSDFYLISS